MSKQTHRICVRMSATEYEVLRRKSRDAGLSMNQYLLRQMRNNRPRRHRDALLLHLVQELNQLGHGINAVAKDFNSGCGNSNQIEDVEDLLAAAIWDVHSTRERGYPYVDEGE